mmetsp:Transcript_4302/g.8686  ORF Transcript_4302/g.8686 Transcript_4302/m.8686 type:complete len:232 (-) Transcript_4302:142-837(-)
MRGVVGALAAWIWRWPPAPLGPRREEARQPTHPSPARVLRLVPGHGRGCAHAGHRPPHPRRGLARSHSGLALPPSAQPLPAVRRRALARRCAFGAPPCWRLGPPYNVDVGLLGRDASAHRGHGRARPQHDAALLQPNGRRGRARLARALHRGGGGRGRAGSEVARADRRSCAGGLSCVGARGSPTPEQAQEGQEEDERDNDRVLRSLPAYHGGRGALSAAGGARRPRRVRG